MYVLIEYDVEIVGDQVLLIAKKEDLEKLERTKIPDNLDIEARPIVAIIGAGASKYLFKKILIKISMYYFRWIYMC